MYEIFALLLDKLTSRTAGAVSFCVGFGMTLLEYLYANPKPEYFFQIDIWAVATFAGASAVVFRSIATWKTAYEKRQSEGAYGRAKAKRVEQAALANLDHLPKQELEALLHWLREGKQRIHVQYKTDLMRELLGHYIFVETKELGDAWSSGMYAIHPAIWARRDEILEKFKGVEGRITDFRGRSRV
ncbi:hypothetical protein KX729_09280 [Rhizobium sp. XQZ8]|uniref:hypothetical protein n=1 Tax=Rhizobium populisoli TaxID=2859785 RepID=UPI001CA4EE21|nr:hypothetical protein [Rhizobium populisoli]MBW6421631.1 hypothetical protein [Rhizobium populisoli]